MQNRFRIISMIQKVARLLNRSQKKTALKVLLLTLVGAVIDVVGLSLVLPVLAISSSPQEILTHEIVNNVYQFLKLENVEQFLLLVYLFLLVVFILRALIFLYVKYVISKFSFGLSRFYSRKLFNVYLHKPLDFFQENNSSDLLRDVYISTQQFATFLIIPIIQNFSELFILVFILGGLILFNINVFFLLIIVLGPISALFYWLTKSKMESIGKEIYHLNGQIINKVRQGISGFIDVKLSSREDFFVRRFDNDQKTFSRLNVIKSVLMDVFPKVIEFSAVLGIVVIFIYSLFFLKEEQKGMIFLLGLFGASAYRLLPSISRMMAGMLLIRQYGYLVDVVKLSLEPTELSHKGGVDNKIDLLKSIKLKDAVFSYVEHNNFKIDIPKLEIAKGEKLGIIGRSGSGKTTLVSILLGFYKLDSGDIIIDGKKLASEDWPGWKNNFGYVQQNVFVSDVSLKENIAFGVESEDIDEKRVIECLSMALLEEFVDTLEDGINSSLGENGMNMSGGQKQRLAIARALYFNRQILVFDEATSALDNETEKEITDSIRSLSEGNITMVIIAHRYDTLRHCDRIIEMERGKIIAEHSYEELSLSEN